jgi:hypothetical protein
MVKRAGRAHDKSGIAGSQEGCCAVQCPACPHQGINLPEGWENETPERRSVTLLDHLSFTIRQMAVPQVPDDGLQFPCPKEECVFRG